MKLVIIFVLAVALIWAVSDASAAACFCGGALLGMAIEETEKENA